MAPRVTAMKRHQSPDPIQRDDALVLTWGSDQNSIQLARALGVTLFESSPWHASLPAIVRYALHTLQTALYLAARRPRLVIYQDPPFVTGLVLLGLRPLLGFTICANAHTGSFNDPRWTRFRAQSRWVFRRCDGIVVHTHSQLQWAKQFGIPVCVVLYAGFAVAASRDISPPEKGQDHILVPLSYSFDEPLKALLEAASLIPHITLVFTGRTPTWMRAAAPANCDFVGWVDRKRYDHLLRTARGVVALTKLEHTAQLSANEAVEAAVPVMASGTHTLRQFHKAGAVFVPDHEPATLAHGLEALWTDHTSLRIGATTMREVAIEESTEQIAQLRDMLGLAPS